MNKNNNKINNHETIFWKVFRNIYIRNYILSKIKNNNFHSYNGTTSLKLMIENNKLHMILDKLKSNHYIHIDTIPDFNNIDFQRKDPYFKSITTEINQLLWSKYNLNLSIDNDKDISSYNSFKAHGLIYKLLLSSNPLQNIQTIQNLIQQVNNNNEYGHIFINNTSNINNCSCQYYIQQLISTSTISSSSLTSSSSSSTLSTPENEIIEAIYNNQPIPTHLNFYYSNQFRIYYNQDLFENQLKVDIKSVLLNIRRHTAVEDCYSKEILELILLKLLYHEYIIELNSYPVNSILHAKIYFINKLYQMKREQYSLLKFKQHLINNQVNTLEELISIAKDIFGLDDDDELKNVSYFGHYYYYYIITSNKLDQFSSDKLEFRILLLNYSVLTQQIELFDKHLPPIDNFSHFHPNFRSIRNSIGNGFNNNDDNNNNKLIKEKSITYFNYLIEQTYQQSNNINEFKRYWAEMFKFIINSYNPKFFEWLLETNEKLEAIYFSLLFCNIQIRDLFLYHTRIDTESDQVDYEMLDVLLKYIRVLEISETPYICSNIGSDDNYNNSVQRKVQIINYLTKSPSNNSSYIIAEIIKNLMSELSFIGLNLADEIIKIYNQVDQQELTNYYSSFNDAHHPLYGQYSDLKLSILQNKSSILVRVLINSIINLDFQSINKIISATINNNNTNKNNNINNNLSIPTTFNNSLDLIKYLISNKYLKEFNLYYILKKIIFNIQVDKEYIIELIRLSTNKLYNTTITTKELTEKVEQLYNKIDQKRERIIQYETEENEKKNQLFTLSTLERIKYELENTKNYEFLDGTILQYIGYIDSFRGIIERRIEIYYSHGYYNAIFQFLNNYKNIDFGLLNLDNQTISIEWFSKLYPLLFKNILVSYYIINQYCYFNPPEIFEFIWNNHFNNNDERIKYIKDILDLLKVEEIHYKKELKLIEYIFKNKKEFIIAAVNSNQNQINKLHKYSLTNLDDIQLFHHVRSIFPSFEFKINYQTISHLFKRQQYQKIEYLYSNNLIPNLEQIIGIENLNNFRIKEINYNENQSLIYISKSMFILIHTIIKLNRKQSNNSPYQINTNSHSIDDLFYLFE